MMKNDTFESLVPGPKYFWAEVFSGPKLSLSQTGCEPPCKPLYFPVRDCSEPTFTYKYVSMLLFQYTSLTNDNYWYVLGHDKITCVFQTDVSKIIEQKR